jgi:hypothetical protein
MEPAPYTAAAAGRGRPALQVLALALLVIGCQRTAPLGLEDTVRRFYLGMAAEDATMNRRAMEQMVPTRDDFVALFPEHHEALWAVWSPEREKLIDNAALHAAEYRAVLPLGAVHTGDLRQEGSLVLRRSLEMIPPEVPVLGVRLEVAGPERERAATAFLFVRGRWIWVWDLERAARLGAGG